MGIPHNMRDDVLFLKTQNNPIQINAMRQEAVKHQIEPSCVSSRNNRANT
jgi:hypothetical protein